MRDRNVVLPVGVQSPRWGGPGQGRPGEAGESTRTSGWGRDGVADVRKTCGWVLSQDLGKGLGLPLEEQQSKCSHGGQEGEGGV